MTSANKPGDEQLDRSIRPTLYCLEALSKEIFLGHGFRVLDNAFRLPIRTFGTAFPDLTDKEVGIIKAGRSS